VSRIPQLNITLKFLFSLLILYRVFSFDIYALTSPDSWGYLDRSVSVEYLSNPLLIIKPYRFKYAGYPIYLSMCYELAPYLGFDPITFVAMSQRLALAIGLVCLIFSMGLFSIPLVVFFSSKVFMVLSNFILTEGVTLPAAIFFSISLMSIYEIRNKENVLKSYKFWFIYLVLFVSFSFLVLTKVNFISYLLPLLAVVFNLKHKKLKSTVVALPVLFLVALSSAYVLAISSYNFRMHNTFSPAWGTETIFYWGAWKSTFSREENKTKLARTFKKGLRGIIREVQMECGYKYPCVGDVMAEKAIDLLNSADISLALERVRSFAFGILGGEKSELDKYMPFFMERRKKPALSICLNDRYSEKKGIRKFFVKYNNGKIPSGVSLIGRASDKGSMLFFLGNTLTFMKSRLLQAALSILMIGGLIYSVVKRNFELHTPYVYVFLSYLTTNTVFAITLTDLWRYMISVWAVFAVLMFYGFKKALGGKAFFSKKVFPQELF